MQDAIPLPAKRNPHLQNYFRSIRKIKHAVASPYLHYVHYEVEGREYTVICFPNHAVRYEVWDDKIFKSTIAPTNISPRMQGETHNASPCIFVSFIVLHSLLAMNAQGTATSLCRTLSASQLEP